MNQKGVEVKAEMLIRKPIAEVFEAFIDPEITTRFWFTKSSGRLEAGKQIRWDWEMYGVSAQVDVKAVEQNARILIEWDEGVQVEWRFAVRAADQTLVTITNTGFKGDDDEVVKNAIDAMGGFTIVLCSLKAFLEHRLNLNLIADRSPDSLVKR